MKGKSWKRLAAIAVAGCLGVGMASTAFADDILYTEPLSGVVEDSILNDLESTGDDQSGADSKKDEGTADVQGSENADDTVEVQGDENADDAAAVQNGVSADVQDSETADAQEVSEDLSAQSDETAEISGDVQAATDDGAENEPDNGDTGTSGEYKPGYVLEDGTDWYGGWYGWSIPDCGFIQEDDGTGLYPRWYGVVFNDDTDKVTLSLPASAIGNNTVSDIKGYIYTDDASTRIEISPEVYSVSADKTSVSFRGRDLWDRYAADDVELWGPWIEFYAILENENGYIDPEEQPAAAVAVMNRQADWREEQVILLNTPYQIFKGDYQCNQLIDGMLQWDTVDITDVTVVTDSALTGEVKIEQFEDSEAWEVWGVKPGDAKVRISYTADEGNTSKTVDMTFHIGTEVYFMDSADRQAPFGEIMLPGEKQDWSVSILHGYLGEDDEPVFECIEDFSDIDVEWTFLSGEESSEILAIEPDADDPGICHVTAGDIGEERVLVTVKKDGDVLYENIEYVSVEETAYMESLIPVRVSDGGITTTYKLSLNRYTSNNVGADGKITGGTPYSDPVLYGFDYDPNELELSCESEMEATGTLTFTATNNTGGGHAYLGVWANIRWDEESDFEFAAYGDTQVHYYSETTNDQGTSVYICDECGYVYTDFEVITPAIPDDPASVEEVTAGAPEEAAGVVKDTLNNIVDAIVSEDGNPKGIDETTAKKVEEAIEEEHDISVELVAENKEAGEVAKEEADSIAEVASDNKAQIAQYLDLSVIIMNNTTDEVLGNITELASPVTIVIAIPETLQKEGRTFFIIMYHGDQAEILETTANEDGTVSFETDKFSTYALAYTDEKPEDPTPVDPTPVDPTPTDPATPENPPTPAEPTPSNPAVPGTTVDTPSTSGGSGTVVNTTGKNNTTKKDLPGKTPAKTAVKTGDNSPVRMLLIVVVVAFGGLVGCFAYRRRAR